MKEWLARKINAWLDQYGIDPLYAMTIICILATLSYWKEFRRWEETDDWRKRLALSAALAAVVLTFFSVIKLFGVIH